MKATFTGLALSLSMVQPGLAKDITMEIRTWPSATRCDTCIVFQFGVLEMHLPTEQINKIFIAGNTPTAVHILPKDATDSRNGIVLMAAPQRAFIGKYRALELPLATSMSAKEFFDKLGQPTRPEDPLSKIRRIESIERAERYIKTSKDKLHAYWVQAAPHHTQYVHLVVDGGETVYSFSGAITPQLYEAILANMRISPEP